MGCSVGVCNRWGVGTFACNVAHGEGGRGACSSDGGGCMWMCDGWMCEGCILVGLLYYFV